MLKKFSNISKISPDNSVTWARKIFLTFDVDWAHDDIIEDCYKIVSSCRVPSTWFVTHQFNLLKTFSNEPLIELGIHPNFNELLFNKSTISSTKIIENILSIVPNAISVRSHSLTNNERLNDIFNNFGISHISNTFIPYESGIKIMPYKIWNDINIIPHNWQDNVSIKMNSKFPNYDSSSSELHVYNFHPIHVFLNTNDLDLYEFTRPIHHKPKELIKYRYSGIGIRSHLLNLVQINR